MVIYHGGYFCGNGKYRDYCAGASVWYDYCDRDNWTPSVIENLIEDLGYECHGRIRVYWCVPDLTICKNGLREIKSGDNTMTENMLCHVRNGNHFQQLFLDHDNSMISYVSPVEVHSSDEEDLPLVEP